jgi:hypothetical protein
MAETPHSQDDQATPPQAIGSYGAPSSSEGQAVAPAEPEATDPGPAESPVLPLGYAPVSSTPAAADLAPAPLAGSYGGSIGTSYGGSYGAAAPLAGSYGAAPAPATSIPTIGSSVEVPPLGGESAEGGEWDLLSGKLRDWFDSNDLGGQWDRLGGPLRASGLLLAGLILIKLYEALLDTLDDIPLLPRLLQLAGLLYLLNFGFTHLIKSQDRENLFQIWKKRWHDFTGRP